MLAVFLKQTGPPDVLCVGELPDPVAGPGQVLIRNHAVAVNPIDTYVRGGVVAMDLPHPFIPGCDAAGVVESVGPGADRYRVGDRVWTTNQGLLGRQGTFAQRIAVDQKWVFPIPDRVSFADAAACGLVGVTAHLGLFREVGLQPGQSILVIGGAGGVGSMVVQMARAAGARVIATGGTDAKLSRIAELGGEVAIDYRTQSIAQATREAEPDGVSVFWETRREPDFELAIAVLAQRGRMVIMAGRDAKPAFPVGPFYVNELSVHGFVMFKATPIEMRHAAEDMHKWMSAGKLVSTIGATMDLADAAQAHQLQENATLSGSAELMGKIVLNVP